MLSDLEKNPYLFVVGCPRSGTTLLQRMLDAHPQLCVANDTYFVHRFIETSVSQDLIDRLVSYHRFHRFGLPEQRVKELGAQFLNYRDFISALYAEYARIHGKVYAGEKSPSYVKHLPLLHHLFPNAKFIHLIRDGRDVALSLKDWAPKKTRGPARFGIWSDEPLAVSALWWKWQVNQGRVEGSKLARPLYCEVRYEDLVSQTETVLHGVTTFLELPFDSKMLRFFEGKKDGTRGLSAKSAWLPPTPGLRHWRSQMSRKEIELFEALAGNLLSTLNYERRVLTFSDEISKLASEYKESWVLELKIRSEERHVSSGARS